MALRHAFKVTVEFQCTRVGCESRLPTLESHDPRIPNDVGNVLSAHGWDYQGICLQCQIDYQDAIAAWNAHGGKRAFSWSDEQKKLYAAWETAWDAANPKPPDWHEAPK
jgi:hypothetical protein